MALVYRLTDDERYAKAAIEWIDIWTNSKTWVNKLYPEYNPKKHTEARDMVEQAGWRYFPNLIEAAFLLRDNKLWLDHPSIDKDFTNWLTDFVVPENVHGMGGWDMSKGIPPIINNHWQIAIHLWFLCNSYLDSWEEEYQNLIKALERYIDDKSSGWETGLPAPNDRVRTWFSNMIKGTNQQFSQEENTELISNTMPIELFRMTYDYSNLSVRIMIDTFRIIYNNTWKNYFTYKNNIGISFEQVLNQYYRFGAWLDPRVMPQNFKPRNTDSHRSHSYEQVGDFLWHEEWSIWADEGRQNINWSADINIRNGTNYSLASILFPLVELNN